MVKHTQTNRRQTADDLFECVRPFCEIGAERLKSLVRNLKRVSEMHNAYDIAIQEQVQNKIIQRISNNGISNSKEFYLSHEPAI